MASSRQLTPSYGIFTEGQCPERTPSSAGAALLGQHVLTKSIRKSAWIMDLPKACKLFQNSASGPNAPIAISTPWKGVIAFTLLVSANPIAFNPPLSMDSTVVPYPVILPQRNNQGMNCLIMMLSATPHEGTDCGRAGRS